MFDFEPEKSQKAYTKAARAAGEKLAKKHKVTTPVDVKQIINAEGFKLIDDVFPENISGYADLDAGEIYVNKIKPNVHQRFTMAHEIGHAILKHRVRKWTEYADLHELSPDKPLEEEANAFAAGLLMPSFLVKPLFEKVKPKDMATLLEVSETALWISLTTYKLI